MSLYTGEENVTLPPMSETLDSPARPFRDVFTVPNHEPEGNLKEFVVVRRSVEDQKMYVMAAGRRQAMKLARAEIQAITDFRGAPISEGVFNTGDPEHFKITFRHPSNAES